MDATTMGIRQPANSPASRQVYELPEIRVTIMRLLDKRDLAVLMRVERKGMGLVTRELYRKMEYNKALKIFSEDESRLQLYQDAVTIINTRSEYKLLDLPDSIRVAFGFLGKDEEDENGDDEWDLICYLREYHPEIVDLLVAPLRERFPYLRKIDFGEEYETMSSTTTWAVTLANRKSRPVILALPPSSPSSSSSPLTPSSPSYPAVGHIQHIECITYDLSEDVPPSSLPSIVPPSETYTIGQQFDLGIYPTKPPQDPRPACFDLWLSAIRDTAWMKDIYKAFDSGPLPIIIADLISIYERQDSSGHGSRLDFIEASYILPFHLGDFQSFATVASSSLTDLRLCDYRDTIYKEGQTRVSFKEFSTLLSIVRASLPNLGHLTIAISGVETAEEDCRDTLEENTLEKRGSIHTLRVFTSEPPSFPFNALRVASTICHEDTNLGIGPSSVCAGRGSDVPSGYISWLRSQCRDRRRWLSTVDFPSLDITTPQQVARLKFRKSDNKPMRRGETMAKAWLKRGKDAEEMATRQHLPTLAAKMTTYTGAAKRYASSSAGASAAEMLSGAREMLESVEAIHEAAKQVQGIVDESQRIGDELAEYIQFLEGSQGRG